MGSRSGEERLIDRRPPVVEIIPDTANGEARVEEVADWVVGGLYMVGAPFCSKATESLISISRYVSEHYGTKYEQEDHRGIVRGNKHDLNRYTLPLPDALGNGRRLSNNLEVFR